MAQACRQNSEKIGEPLQGIYAEPKQVKHCVRFLIDYVNLPIACDDLRLSSYLDKLNVLAIFTSRSRRSRDLARTQLLTLKTRVRGKPQGLDATKLSLH